MSQRETPKPAREYSDLLNRVALAGTHLAQAVIHQAPLQTIHVPTTTPPPHSRKPDESNGATP
jgi:hypothetical protein